MRLAWRWKDAGHFLLVNSFVFLVWSWSNSVHCMSEERKSQLKEEAREMFFHGYNAYMDNGNIFSYIFKLSV